MFELKTFVLVFVVAVVYGQVEYEWRIEEYGQCSATECGYGWRFRQVTCVIVGTTQVQSEINCAGVTKPSNWQQCFAGVCGLTGIATSSPTTSPTPAVDYEWVSYDWGLCSQSCGSGFQSRIVGCTANGSPISSVFCEGLDSLGPKPEQLQDCNTDDCPSDPVVSDSGVTYDYFLGDWDVCSAECDGGLQTRQVICVGRDESYAYPAQDTDCKAVKPSTEQICNMEPCDPTIGTTSAPTRAPSTQPPVQATTEASTTQAPSTQPPVQTTTQTPTQDPNIQIRYIEGSFGECSATCGYATRSRHVLCVQTINGAHSHVDDSVCPGTKPDEIIVCEGLSSCPGESTTVTIEETTPLATPSQTTMLQITTTIAQATTLEFKQTTLYINEEATTEYVVDPSIERPTYVVGYFGECDCSIRQRTRNVACVDYRTTAVVLVADKHCAAVEEKPHATEDCETNECPPDSDNTWVAELDGDCSVTCGGGVQRFRISCTNGINGNVISENLCDADQRPSETEECANDECDDILIGSYWSIDAWEECDVTCGVGVQTRPVTCYRYVGGPTNEISTECDIDSKPHSTQECDAGRCHGFWVSSQWSECSASCGFGIQSRTVDCRWDKTDLTTIEDSRCNSSKPFTQTGCKLDDCPIDYECGKMLKGSGGNISSPLYPENYPNDVICKNVLVAESSDSGNGSYIEINFRDLQIEEETDCNFDYIEVYDMMTGIIDRICTVPDMPMKWTSQGNTVEVTFVSDASISKKGYSASWQMMQKS